MRWAFAITLTAMLPLAACTKNADDSRPRSGVTTTLHLAAARGELGEVEKLINEGLDANAPDEKGRTPLHLAAENGHGQTTVKLLSLGADPELTDMNGNRPYDLAIANRHDETAAKLVEAGGGAVRSTDTQAPTVPAFNVDDSPRLNPELKYPSLESFEQTIGGSGCLLTSEHVYLFAPKSREAGAQIVFPYLVRAYDELKKVVGVDTAYIMVVYNFPPGHPDAKGGTSNCTIWYDDSNLDLEKHEEWRKYHVPHVSGYIEEMAHNFVSGLHMQFGWEMTGWSIGVLATSRVATNPIFEGEVRNTRRVQQETFERYMANGKVFPGDIPPNLVDRIHAHLLYRCERQYGPQFWPDFFAEVGKERSALANAITLGEGNAVRNERYRISVECFDRLPGLDFKEKLEDSGISLTTDIKSLDPEGTTWNRRLE